MLGNLIMIFLLILVAKISHQILSSLNIAGDGFKKIMTTIGGTRGLGGRLQLASGILIVGVKFPMRIRFVRVVTLMATVWGERRASVRRGSHAVFSGMDVVKIDGLLMIGAGSAMWIWYAVSQPKSLAVAPVNFKDG